MSEVGDWLRSLSATRISIDLASKQLSGLRQCRELDDLVKKEIRERENELINKFGTLILTQTKLNQHNSKYSFNNENNNHKDSGNNENNNHNDNIINDANNNPNDNTSTNNGEFSDIEYWLKVVGVNKKLISSLSKKMTMTEMVGMSTDGLKEELMKEELMKEGGGASNEDAKVLLTAVQNLKIEMKNISSSNNSKLDLSWSTFKNSSPSYHITSYTSNSPKPPRHHPHQFHQQRPSTSSIPTETTTIHRKKNPNTPPPISTIQVNEPTYLAPRFNHSTAKYGHATLPAMTPPPTPISKSQKKFPTTPPLGRKIKLHFDPLTKSKSHESQLSIKISQDGLDHKKRFFRKKPSAVNLVSSSDALVTSPSHLNAPHPDHKNHSISDDALTSTNVNQLRVPPISPDANLWIHHKFHSRPVWGSCDMCHRQLTFISRVCKHCKLKFHQDCAPKYNRSCEESPGPHTKQEYRMFLLQKHGAPQQKQQINQQLNPQQQQLLSNQQQQLLLNHQQQLLLQDSSSNSSCNSSTPSSPTTSSSATHFHPPHHHLYHSENTHFKYPEPGDSFIDQSYETPHTPKVLVSNADVINTTDSDKSDKTITGSGCSSSTQTTSSSNMEHTDSLDSNDDQHLLFRDHSISLKELSIPYDELKILNRIGEGRFGTVFKGWWHGDVAIKQLNIKAAEDDNLKRETFKLEVDSLKKTRHERLVLFMGACIEFDRLAIITSYIDGSSINDMIHQDRRRFALNQVLIIAAQIAQGLGYLHAKEIAHRNLRLNNVFLSKNKKEIFKVIITDYGLSLDQLCQSSRQGYWLSIPSGWLSYQSPEIIRALRITENQPDLPYSKESDIYAFGTIWHELLTSKRPHHKLTPEEVIWLIGTGSGRPKINAQPEYVEVSTRCWSFESSKRPTCEWLLSKMETLPRKRLSRSPSHPIQITRSVKPIF